MQRIFLFHSLRLLLAGVITVCFVPVLETLLGMKQCLWKLGAKDRNVLVEEFEKEIALMNRFSVLSAQGISFT